MSRRASARGFTADDDETELGRRSMGLAERTIAESYERERFPAWKVRIDSAAGIELSYEIAFEPLVKAGFLEVYPETLDFNFFAPLEAAIRSVCVDDLGKAAFKEKIRTIKITSERSWSSLAVKVDGNTIHLDADPSYSRTADCVSDYTKAIILEVEKAL
jgi:hypothetical protein